MSGAITLALEALVQLVPLVETLLDQAKNGTVPTVEQEAEVLDAINKANAAIQAS